MTKTEILKFINANPNCFVSTVEGDKPHVRAYTMYKADENGILFQTWKIKDIYNQLQKNQNAEICFINARGDTQVRISGKLELVEDMDLKKEVVSVRTFMKPVVDARGWDVVAMYRMKNGKASVWTREVNFEPKTYIEL